MTEIYQARIYAKCGGTSILTLVDANDSYQARKIIELRPDFKSFSQQPQKI